MVNATDVLQPKRLIVLTLFPPPQVFGCSHVRRQMPPRRESSATQLLDLDSSLCCAFRFIYTVMFFDGKVTVQVTSALFWDITQRTVVIPCRRLGTTFRYHLPWSGIYVLESIDP